MLTARGTVRLPPPLAGCARAVQTRFVRPRTVARPRAAAAPRGPPRRPAPGPRPAAWTRSRCWPARSTREEECPGGLHGHDQGGAGGAHLGLDPRLQGEGQGAREDPGDDDAEPDAPAGRGEGGRARRREDDEAHGHLQQGEVDGAEAGAVAGKQHHLEGEGDRRAEAPAGRRSPPGRSGSPPARSPVPSRATATATAVRGGIAAPKARSITGVKTTKRPVISPAVPGRGALQAIGLERVAGGHGDADHAPDEERAALREAAGEEQQHQHGQPEAERQEGGHRVAGRWSP